MPAKVTRRSFVAGATLGSVSVLTRSLGPPDVARTSEVGDYTFTQFHNQPMTSALHRRLVEMWAAIGRETRGRVATRVFAENDAVPGSDPAVLKMLVGGEIQFFTLMGGILGTVVPAAEVQQVPFAFRSAAQAHRAMDGALGGYLLEEMAAKGIRGFLHRRIRQRDAADRRTKRPIVAPDDLIGLRMHGDCGVIRRHTFRALGADPITIGSAAGFTRH